MALANYAAFKAAQPHARAQLGKATLTVVSGRQYSRWAIAPFAGVNPSSAVAPTSATLGAAPQGPAPGLATWIKSAQMARTAGGVITICDRLSHQGGLSGIVTTTQTTNLPTAALTRCVGGVGVMMAFEVYGTIGATATTITVSYTNSAGTAGRTSPAITFAGTGNNGVARFQILPFQSGDVGVRSVESVLLAGSSGTAGTWGITLFKPLLAIPCFGQNENAQFDAVRNMGAAFENVAADACLWQLWAGGQVISNTTAFTPGVINLIKQV